MTRGLAEFEILMAPTASGAVLVDIKAREFWPHQTLASGVEKILTNHRFVAVALDWEFGKQHVVILLRDGLVIERDQLPSEFAQRVARVGTALITTLYLRFVVSSVRSRFRWFRTLWSRN